MQHNLQINPVDCVPRMIHAMANRISKRKIYVRVPNAVRRALKSTLERLNDVGFLAGEQDLTQEQLVAASWLWMRDQSTDVLLRSLRPYFEKLEELEFPQSVAKQMHDAISNSIPPGTPALSFGESEPEDDDEHGVAKPTQKPSPGSQDQRKKKPRSKPPTSKPK